MSMSEQDEDVATDEIVEGEEATESNEDSVEETQEDTASNEELEKLRKANSDLLISRKKAEAEVKRLKEAQANSSKSETQVSDNLSQKDVIYLAKSDIHEDDTDEVLKYASTNKVSVKEAHEYLKPILAVRAEQRQTAAAANTGSSRRSSGKMSDDVLLDNASKGKATDPEAVAEARMNIKLRK